MKTVVLGAYFTAHFDIPVQVEDDFDVNLTSGRIIKKMIDDGLIKFIDTGNENHNETGQDAINGGDLGDIASELFEMNLLCGTFHLSKFNYVMDAKDTKFLKNR